jgi:hypothetical protein
VLTTDFLYPSTGESLARDGRFWNYWPHIKRLYYQVYDTTDIEYDTPKSALLKDTLNGASVIIKMERLKELVDSALEHMS